MTRHPFLTGCAAAAVLLCNAAAAASPAAAGSPAAEAQALMRSEMAACASGATSQSRKDCENDARSAYAQNRAGTLAVPGASHARNSLLRCDALAGSDRVACVARMQGRGTTTGSVATGGIYREMVTVTIEDPAPSGKAP